MEHAGTECTSFWLQQLPARNIKGRPVSLCHIIRQNSSDRTNSVNLKLFITIQKQETRLSFLKRVSACQISGKPSGNISLMASLISS